MGRERKRQRQTHRDTERRRQRETDGRTENGRNREAGRTHQSE